LSGDGRRAWGLSGSSRCRDEYGFGYGCKERCERGAGVALTGREGNRVWVVAQVVDRTAKGLGHVARGRGSSVDDGLSSVLAFGLNGPFLEESSCRHVML